MKAENVHFIIWFQDKKVDLSNVLKLISLIQFFSLPSTISLRYSMSHHFGSGDK